MTDHKRGLDIRARLARFDAAKAAAENTEYSSRERAEAVLARERRRDELLTDGAADIAFLLAEIQQGCPFCEDEPDEPEPSNDGADDVW